MSEQRKPGDEPNDHDHDERDSHAAGAPRFPDASVAGDACIAAAGLTAACDDLPAAPTTGSGGSSSSSSGSVLVVFVVDLVVQLSSSSSPVVIVGLVELERFLELQQFRIADAKPEHAPRTARSRRRNRCPDYWCERRCTLRRARGFREEREHIVPPAPTRSTRYRRDFGVPTVQLPRRSTIGR